MIFAWKIVIIAVLSYFIGNLNFAIIISKIKHGDIRKSGSGNPGTMNMIRSYGKAIGAICLVLDALSAAIPALIFWWWLCGDGWLFGSFWDQSDKLGLYVSGLSVVIGRIYPVCMKFHGGKGIACIIGISFVSNPVVTLTAFGIGLLFLIFFKIGALSSFIMIYTPNIFAAVTYPFGWYSGLYGEPRYIPAVLALIFSLVLLSLFAHRKNVLRLFSGTENRTVLFPKKPKAEKAK